MEAGGAGGKEEGGGAHGSPLAEDNEQLARSWSFFVQVELGRDEENRHSERPRCCCCCCASLAEASVSFPLTFYFVM